MDSATGEVLAGAAFLLTFCANTTLGADMYEHGCHVQIC